MVLTFYPSSEIPLTQYLEGTVSCDSNMLALPPSTKPTSPCPQVRPGRVTSRSRCHLSVHRPRMGSADLSAGGTGGGEATHLCQHKGLQWEQAGGGAGCVSRHPGLSGSSWLSSPLLPKFPPTGRDRVPCPSLPWGASIPLFDLSASPPLSFQSSLPLTLTPTHLKDTQPNIKGCLQMKTNQKYRM